MIITYSMIRAFQTCRRKMEHNYIDMIQKKGTAPLYFLEGRAFHRAMELIGILGCDVTTEIIDKQIENIFQEDFPGTEWPETLKKWEKAKELVCAVVRHYIETNNNAFEWVVGTEIPFCVPILDMEGQDTGDFLAGIVDGMVLEHGELWLKEYKYLAGFSNADKIMLKLDIQSMAYLEAMERFTGKNIVGVKYEVALKKVPDKPTLLKPKKKTKKEIAKLTSKQITDANQSNNPNVYKNPYMTCELSKSKNQNTTVKLYREAIKENGLNEDDYKEILTHLRENPKEYFYTAYLPFSNEALQEWRMELYQTVLQIKSASKHGFYQRNPYFSSVRGSCTYLGVCSLNPENRDTYIKEFYEKKEHPNSELLAKQRELEKIGEKAPWVN